MSYEEDVRFVGAFLRGGDWEVGLRIARNVDPTGKGGRPKTGENSPVNQKVSLTVFAGEAGVAKETVAKYLAAWIWASRDGVVPAPETLDATSDFDFDGMDWSTYYETACKNPPPWSTTATAPMEGRKSPGRHIGRNAIIEGIKADPSLVADAVKADPKVADAAWEAIEEKAIERADNAALAAIQRGGKVTPIEKTELGSAWAATKSAASRSEAIQALDDAVGVLEAAAKLVRGNGSPIDNEGEQIEELNNRIIDVAAQLSNLNLEVAR